MFDIGSFWFIFSAFVLMLLSSTVFRTPRQAKIVLLGTILSSALVLVFQSAHLFMPNILSLGILSGQTGNVFGSWNALGLFAGFSALMLLLVVEFFPISRIGKILLEIFILLSILLAMIINFPLVWILLGISALIIFVYKTSITLHNNGDEETKRHFPIISFVVVLISLLFLNATSIADPSEETIKGSPFSQAPKGIIDWLVRISRKKPIIFAEENRKILLFI